ncbi:DNA polymerase Y family protein [Streptomyces sp. NPDC001220]
MRAESTGRRSGVVMHVRCPDRLSEEGYRQVLEQLAELSPVVQALPPTAALVDLRGALRYHGVTASHLGEILRLRTVSRYGVDVRVGIGPTITVAATASAQVPHPGGVLTVEGADAADWLALLPVEDLHGIGPRQAAALHRYGVNRVGLLAALPAATVQRLLGKAGRTAVDRARGIDPRTVTPQRLPASVSVRHRFPHDVLDGATARSALLGLVVQLGAELRRRAQAARALTLTLTFAGGPAWEKTRRLAEPSGHEDDLRRLTYQIMDAAGLQRGRLTGLALRGEDLVDSDQVAEQLSLDAARQARLAAEGAADRIRERFGPGAIGPTATYRPAS